MPDDILTLLLKAQDPETGQPMSEAEVRANIITFIAAGHETTANTITWSLFLLSQSSQWQERVVAEAERDVGQRHRVRYEMLRFHRQAMLTQFARR